MTTHLIPPPAGPVTDDELVDARAAERQREVSRYDVIGGVHPELDDLVRLAVSTTGMPAAAINLMQAGTQETVAAVGLETGMCALEDSMCARILYDGQPVQVEDASVDPRWSDNPYVNGERASIRFYYAHQLVSPRGTVVGTLCVFDYQPRVLDAETLYKLDRIACWIVDILELRLRTRDLESAVTELTRARNELQRSNEMLGLFAGQVAHDLRGPVTALNISLGMLHEQLAGQDSSENGWLLERALGSVTRMDELIAGMLAYASVGGHPEIDDVDLAEVMSLVRTDLDGQLDGVSLEVDGLGVVRGDAVQWRVVLQNLVANAVKFSRRRGESLVRVSSGTDSSGWWLEVADDGPGIPVADRERVFDVMTQGDPAHEGIGLGLATCLRIVSAHRGTITLGDAPEGGALVRIDVPTG